MVTYWSQMTNPIISSYPNLQQIGSFIDDGYGSVHRFGTSQVGAILSSNDDGYVQADPTGTGKGFVTGWNTLTGRVTALENAQPTQPYENNPLMDGTASAGSANEWSRGDHRHPKDTSKEDVANKTNTFAGNTDTTHYPTTQLVKNTTDALDVRLTALEEKSAVIYISNSSPTSAIGNNGDVYILY